MADVICQSCSSGDIRIFHRLEAVPSNSCILLSSRGEAMNYPKGNIYLGFCERCGFISNVAFDSRLTEYSDRYEETQGFSPTFNEFQKKLAEELIERYQLHNKDIIEIGCGKGEFLNLLCEAGNNRGIGFDPGYLSDRNKGAAAHQINFIKDFYSEKYSHYQGDFIVCKMTLEHIFAPFEFLSMIRRSIGNSLNTVVYFQVPDVTRILKECAFEDIYYEHCSYFSPGSLIRLFHNCEFTVLRYETGYNNQYLMIEARPSAAKGESSLSGTDDLNKLKAFVANFETEYRNMISQWRTKLHDFGSKGQKVVLWGSGSKAVAFLTSLNIVNEVEFVVDINPHRHGFYMAGTGQRIVSPAFLKAYVPDVIIIMNSIYRNEIQKDIERMGLEPELLNVE